MGIEKFGLFLGRMQPFHKGHQEIINEILLDKKIPIVVLGSSNLDRDKKKNPLTYAQRKELIQLVYPNIPMIFVRNMDFDSWDTWFDQLWDDVLFTLEKEIDYLGNLEDLKKELVIYYHNKEVDRTDFCFKGNLFKKTFYTDIFEKEGFNTRRIKFVNRDDIVIKSNARDIRKNIEMMKHLLDARVYFKLKEWGF